MIDQKKIEPILVAYKANFTDAWWNGEKYKWVAIQHFQNTWDIDAPNFPEMLKEALSKSRNLLDVGGSYPRDMINKYAKCEPETVREMFRNLFDESQDYVQRFQTFMQSTELLRQRYPEQGKNHYQGSASVTCYSWLRYPDDHYLFKPRYCQHVASLLDYNHVTTPEDAKIPSGYKMYDEIREILKNDAELVRIFQGKLTPDCYPDPELHALTVDFVYYVEKKVINKDKKDEPAVDTTQSPQTIQVPQPTEVPKRPQYWIFSPGMGASMWEEFYNEGIMGIPWEELGDLSEYKTREEFTEALKETYGKSNPVMHMNCLWDFTYEMRPGDIVFAKKGKSTILGRGVVTSDYIYAPERGDFTSIRNVRWTHCGTWEHPGNAVTKTLTNITKYHLYCEKLEACINVQPIQPTEYNDADFLAEVFMSQEQLDILKRVAKVKKNVIFQGAPGTGKTFVAKRLAWTMMGWKDESRVQVIQFHQSYSYEDFIMGFRPSGDENHPFELKFGPFYEFCRCATADPEHDYFFIIDEINRGNVSKIFGELFMLVENSKRGEALALTYLPNETFSVPKNVYIIGTMNTADRSLALIDYALRRRFSFVEFEPAFDSEGFQRYLAEMNNATLNRLTVALKKLNEEIVQDDTLGPGFQIGHSFLYTTNSGDVSLDAWLKDVVEMDIIPLLKEYWFDEPQKWQDAAHSLRSITTAESVQ